MPKMLAAASMLAAAGAAQAASAWTDLFQPPFTGSPLQIMLGMSCTSKSACFVAGGTTSSFGVYKVTDTTFKSGVRQLNTTGSSPLKMMLAVAMEDETHGVSGGLGLGVGGTYYSVDGEDFQGSALQVGILQTQAMYSMGGGKYAYVGTYNANQGVAVSTNGGVTFKGAWLPKNFSEAPVRYGAFPTADVIYVTGGSWPSSDNPPSGTRDISSRLRYNSTTGKYEHRAPVLGSADDGYSAMIAKSTDGGATWEKQYENIGGSFYFNGISCASADVCMAVAEGATGAHVFKTEDGGKTWNDVYQYGSTTGGSAMDVKMLSETEAWVGFSFAVSTFNSGAAMGHTTDGGKTWEISPTLSGVGVVSQMSFVDDNTAFAAAVTVFQISTVLAFGS